jgi:uncharacterized protein (TIGR01777 family)
MTKNVLISGGSGLVGTAIMDLLISKGYTVALLSRSAGAGKTRRFQWDIDAKTIDPEAIEFADIIIHLAGENVSSKRWSAKQKKRIVDSRVESTKLLYEAIKASTKKPELFISASAVGYYGYKDPQNAAIESDSSGDDFLARTVDLWEGEVKKFEALTIPTIRVRIGVVIAPKGGLLKSILPFVKWGLAAPIGSGKQFVPWIELSDLAQLFYFVMTKEKPAKVYNAVAPEFLTNKDLMRALAQKMNKPFFLPPVPSFMIRLLYGEMGDIILFGKKVSSEKVRSDGFRFKSTSLEEVIKNYPI